MRRIVGGVLIAAGAFWALPAIYTFVFLGGMEGSTAGSGLLVIFTALIYVFPGLLLIGLGTLIWPSRPSSKQ